MIHHLELSNINTLFIDYRQVRYWQSIRGEPGPLAASGTASDASRQLVDECLAADGSPEAEVRLLEEIRWTLRSRTYQAAAAIALGTLLVGGMLVGVLLTGR